MNSIIFAGSGHGGLSALISLQATFDKVYVLSEDVYIHQHLRGDDELILGFMDVETKTVVCAGYMDFISNELLKEKTFINTHPSLLPEYRGIHSLAWAMLNFESVLGFTIHIMNEAMDDGPILDQFFLNYRDQTSKEVMDIFDDYVKRKLGRVVKEYIEGLRTPVEQDKSVATWVSKRNIEDCIINFNDSIVFIERLFKVLVAPYPLPIIKVGDELYEIIEVGFKYPDYYTNIGRVVNVENGSSYIKVSDGLLVVKKIRKYGCRKVMAAENILTLGKRL